MRSLLVAALVAAVVTGTFAAPSPVEAREPSVRIRQVTVTDSVQLDASTVRTTLGEELAGVANLRGGKRAELTVRVARRTAVDGNVEYVVSAVVQDARGGNVLGMIEGRAGTSTRTSTGTSTAPRSSDALERRMLHDAAHGALANLPDVLR